MNAQRDYTDFLRDILEYAEKAAHFVEGVDFQAFQKNEEKMLAVTGRYLKQLMPAPKSASPSPV